MHDWLYSPIPKTTKYLGFTISASGTSIQWDNLTVKAIKSLLFWKKLPLGIPAKANFFKSYALCLFRYYIPICPPNQATASHLDNILYYHQNHTIDPSYHYQNQKLDSIFLHYSHLLILHVGWGISQKLQFLLRGFQ